MAKERKSPQEKKRLEYTRDHFTGGFDSSRMFPRTWRRKKTRVNREYRRKSEEILAQAKPGIATDDVEVLGDDLTAARFEKSVIRRRLHKAGTVTLGEKVRYKLEKRKEMVGRRVERQRHYAKLAASAIKTLRSLAGERLEEVARRAHLLCVGRNADELKRVTQSSDPIDQALHFLYRLSSGSAFEFYAIRKDADLHADLALWVKKANRVLDREKRALARKIVQEQQTKKKVKALNSQRLDLSPRN